MVLCLVCRTAKIAVRSSTMATAVQHQLCKEQGGGLRHLLELEKVGVVLCHTACSCYGICIQYCAVLATLSLRVLALQSGCLRDGMELDGSGMELVLVWGQAQQVLRSVLEALRPEWVGGVLSWLRGVAGRLVGKVRCQQEWRESLFLLMLRKVCTLLLRILKVASSEDVEVIAGGLNEEVGSPPGELLVQIKQCSPPSPFSNCSV